MEHSVSDGLLIATRPENVARCFGCKNLYSINQLLAREGFPVCRRRCADRRDVFELSGAVIEFIG
jgi:hypothetical protein